MSGAQVLQLVVGVLCLAAGLSRLLRRRRTANRGRANENNGTSVSRALDFDGLGFLVVGVIIVGSAFI